jgi:hypothetical protein
MAQPIGHGGRDSPDWGVSALQSTNAIVADNSELAARLGSINALDRTGNMLIGETFESGLTNWSHNSSPVGAYAVPTARYCARVPYSIKLKTTGDVNSYSGIRRGIPVPYITRLGFEFHFRPESTLKRFIATFNIYDGTYRYLPQIEFDKENNSIFLTKGDATDHEIASYAIQDGLSAPFHFVKMVVDLENEFYQRVNIDEIDYDVSTVSLRKIASAVNPYLLLDFMVYSFGSNIQTVYVDNIIVTIDEPR